MSAKRWAVPRKKSGSRRSGWRRWARVRRASAQIPLCRSSYRSGFVRRVAKHRWELFRNFEKLRNLRIDHRVVCKRNYPIESATDGGAGDKNLLQPSSLPRLQNLALVNMPTTTDDAELVSSFKKSTRRVLRTDSRMHSQS